MNPIILTPFFKLQHPFTCIVAAPAKAGKPTFVSRLIKFANQMIEQPPGKIIWCYTEWQLAYEHLPKVELHRGLPDVEGLRKNYVQTLFVLDALLTDVGNNSQIV